MRPIALPPTSASILVRKAGSLKFSFSRAQMVVNRMTLSPE
jgi:hypothetical protein